MRSLPRPAINVRESLDACLPHLADPNLVARLGQVRDALAEAETAYIARGGDGTLYQIAPTLDVAGIVSRDEMVALYSGTFRRKKTEGRKLYNKLKGLAPNGICPLCGAQQAKTLDHCLPKSGYPTFSITPSNLVPSCSDCNRAKLAHQPGGENDQSLHPYFDHVDDAQWLFAEVLEESPAAVKYFTDPPAGWPGTKRERVARHFISLELGPLFTAQASDHLPGMRYRLQRLLARVGVDAVRGHLSEELEDLRRDRQNSWQIAMYDALVASDWYCTGGFDA